MDVTLTDALFVVHWMASRSLAEVGRRQRESLRTVLATAGRLRADNWPLPALPFEDTAPPARGRKPVLVQTPGVPHGAAWEDGDGTTWVPEGKGGRSKACFRCGQLAGPNGLNRLTRRGEPGRRVACPECVKVVSLPAAWSETESR